jgi:hypothetical protein
MIVDIKVFGGQVVDVVWSCEHRRTYYCDNDNTVIVGYSARCGSTADLKL